MRAAVFFAAPPPLRRASPSAPRPSPRCCSAAAHRVLLVPNHVGAATEHQKHLYQRVRETLPHTLRLCLLPSFPNPYQSNTKRWERVWLSELRAAVTDGSNVTLFGHGSGADACLRLLETHRIEGGLACFLATGDEYYAAERHGRAYDWRAIRRNVGNERVALVTSDGVASQQENENLFAQLRATMWLDVAVGRPLCAVQNDMVATIAHACKLDERHVNAI